MVVPEDTLYIHTRQNIYTAADVRSMIDFQTHCDSPIVLDVMVVELQ